jgi:GT2 family glycosyltransferase
MKNNMIAVLIVLYDTEISNSVSISSILSCDNLDKVSITIVNNGPRKIQGPNDFVDTYSEIFRHISFIESIDNRPLSKLYNEFLNDNVGNDNFVILDGDSCFEHNYFTKIINKSFDLYVPRILSVEDGKYYYPTIYKNVVSSEGSLTSQGLMSISSGLVINSTVVTLMKKKYSKVFDESFALYGVDTSFFLRLRTLKVDLNIVCGSVINHSLSRVKKEEISSFRFKERLYDTAIIARRYPNIERVIYYLKRLLKSIILFRITDAYSLIYYFIKGKHPRC